jgi:hypothetical protein
MYKEKVKKQDSIQIFACTHRHMYTYIYMYIYIHYIPFSIVSLEIAYFKVILIFLNISSSIPLHCVCT